MLQRQTSMQRNHYIRSNKHAIILCGVDLGRSKTMYHARHPGPRYDSVEMATVHETREV
ncbi:uncharacterized protein BDW43DRAFT_262192 [Aspergillus alliaceus]|uniref:uncharacterized protein n=1 Tax=Petromyces alliaceus TaxID=209559 RepID=UPI0012A4C83F|nr:uncharacterized protein BDW43DRAFT_262192 [Aspergillus alliaceus]KAB8238621.1 hypothetical protein BDW43DRAFT_262192 [Aspergillus alliaceus]